MQKHKTVLSENALINTMFRAVIMKEEMLQTKESWRDDGALDVDACAFSDYLNFLSESSSLSLPQMPNQGNDKPTWKKVRAGFDKVQTPEDQNRLREEGKKIRTNPLLGKGNPKLAKEKLNPKTKHLRTLGLSLTPAREGRLNTCASATPECAAACLNKAGRGRMEGVKTGRMKRMDHLIDHPAQFMAALHGEIHSHEKSARAAGETPVVRPNIVSDIPFEKLHSQLFTHHPNTILYDYTKHTDRVMNPDGTPKPNALPIGSAVRRAAHSGATPDDTPNYHLTLSSTGIHAKGNWSHVRQHLNNGGVAAMVFAVGKGERLPTHVHDEATGVTHRVVDGDESDHRHMDHENNGIPHGTGVIAGLRIKGGKKLLAAAADFAVKVPHGATVVRVPPIHGTTMHGATKSP